jgi:hypothetical protein
VQLSFSYSRGPGEEGRKLVVNMVSPLNSTLKKDPWLGLEEGHCAWWMTADTSVGKPQGVCVGRSQRLGVPGKEQLMADFLVPVRPAGLSALGGLPTCFYLSSSCFELVSKNKKWKLNDS